MSDRTRIVFTPVPITGLLGCCVPVIPGTQDTDAPLEQRTELCAIDANWVVGSVPTCDIHVRQVCEMTGIDWPGVVSESGRDLAHANRPAGERECHTQEQTRTAADELLALERGA